MKNYQVVLEKAFQVLLNTDEYQGDYSQKQVVQMLCNMGFSLSEGTLSNLRKEVKKHIAPRKAKKYGVQLETLIKLILGLEFDTTTSSFIPTKDPDWKPMDLLQIKESPTTEKTRENAVFHPLGRWSPSDKVKFFQPCQQELIEFGVKLENFASYFDKYGDGVYKSQIIDLLKKGVTVKCYMLDPHAELTRLYFQDRNKADKEGAELDALKRLPQLKIKLVKIANELNQLGHKGQFEVYTYQHIPYNHFLSVDRDTPNARMLVSHYIYGIKRSKSPLLVFSKRAHPALYKLYLESLNKMIDKATKIAPLKTNAKF